MSSSTPPDLTYALHHPTIALVREASPAYDPTVDALTELGDEIATLAAHIHAATHRLLVLIAEFDERRGWELDGQLSCAHWLAWRTGIDLGAAREKVRTARALTALPETSAAMARGELSFSQVRALTRVVDAESEGPLLALARGTTAAQLERLLRGFRQGSRQDEAERARQRHESRTFSVFPEEDGMYVVRGRLPAEVGALLMRAIEAASDALYRENGVPVVDEVERERAAAQRRADAVGLLAERALAAGFDADALVSGTRAARYQVMLHVDADTLVADSDVAAETSARSNMLVADSDVAAETSAAQLGRSELEDGTRVSAETSRRIACDAGVVRVTHDAHGDILNVGRRTRTIPPALRRALEVRDRGCRFPGCGRRFTDAHHVTHWADGGETSLSNTLLLCHHHHRLVHEGGWQLAWWGEGRPVFTDPRGNAHFEGGWQAPNLSAQPVAALVAANRIRPEPWAPRWKREADIPDDVLYPALEALG